MDFKEPARRTERVLISLKPMQPKACLSELWKMTSQMSQHTHISPDWNPSEMPCAPTSSTTLTLWSHEEIEAFTGGLEEGSSRGSVQAAQRSKVLCCLGRCRAGTQGDQVCACLSKGKGHTAGCPWERSNRREIHQWEEQPLWGVRQCKDTQKFPQQMLDFSEISLDIMLSHF